MNPNSLKNLKNNPTIKKHGILKEGQLSHTIRVRISAEIKELLKETSPEELGRILTEALKSRL
jgi:hypothetical protein